MTEETLNDNLMITEKSMNNQQIFNAVLVSLDVQGGPARGDAGQCQYKTEEGLSCAVGCLLSDDFSTEGFEEQNVEDLVHSLQREGIYKEVMLGIDPTPVTLKLLRGLQTAHDENRHYKKGVWVDKFYEAMETVARNNGLTYNEKLLLTREERMYL